MPAGRSRGRHAALDLLTMPAAVGVCIPWEEKLRELPPISGDAALFRRIWDDLEGQAYTYIWHLLLSF